MKARMYKLVHFVLDDDLDISFIFGMPCIFIVLATAMGYIPMWGFEISYSVVMLPVGMAMCFMMTGMILRVFLDQLVFSRWINREKQAEAQFMASLPSILASLPEDMQKDFYERIYATMKYYTDSRLTPWHKFTAWVKHLKPKSQ